MIHIMRRMLESTARTYYATGANNPVLFAHMCNMQRTILEMELRT